MSIAVDRMVKSLVSGLVQLGAAAILSLVFCGAGLGLLFWAREGFAPGAGAIFATSFNFALIGLFSQLYTFTMAMEHLAMVPPSSWGDALPSGETFAALAPVAAILLPRHLRFLGATGGFLSLTIMGIYLVRMHAL